MASVTIDSGRALEIAEAVAVGTVRVTVAVLKVAVPVAGAAAWGICKALKAGADAGYAVYSAKHAAAHVAKPVK